MAKSQAKTPHNPRWIPPEADAAARAELRLCEAEDCVGQGDYPAPKSRDSLRDYHWFCLDHVRAYNSKWDFLKGMNPTQIENFIRESTVGGRPTQPIAGLGGKAYENLLRANVLRDFGGFQMEDTDPDTAHLMAGFSVEEIKACRTLGLQPTRDFKAIKTRYRKLAKEFHPDARAHHDPTTHAAAEDKLKVINQAYGVLKAAAHSSAS